MKKTIINKTITNDDFLNIVRDHHQISLSQELKNRVNKSEALVKKWVAEERTMYGITTGFGALSTRTGKATL